MSDRLLDTSAPENVSAIAELSCVRLVADLDVLAHGRLPAGSAGTVVSVYGGGEAYCVEITQPFHALVTLDAEQVAVIPGATRADFDAASRGVFHRSR